MKIPSLPFASNDFLRYPEHCRLAHTAKAPTPETIAELHAVVRTGTPDQVERALVGAEYHCHATRPAVQLMATEPTTGNSLMHTALIAQRIDLVDILRRFRSHNAAAYRQPFYALHSHARHDGDTILHSAVRSGKQELLTAAFQVFRGQYLDSPDESLQSDEAAQRVSPWWDDENEEEIGMRIGELMFLLRHNDKGRTAAAEARVLGHADMAAWLERATQVDDPHGDRRDASVMQLWREGCDEYYGLP